MLPPNSFGNLNKSMVYGMTLTIPSLNENSELDLLSMFKKKEKIANRAQQQLEQQSTDASQTARSLVEQTPPRSKSPVHKTISGIKERRDKKTKYKTDEQRKRHENAQHLRDFWNLYTLIDQEKEEQRMQNSKICKIWDETKHADPLMRNLYLPGNYIKKYITLQPILIKSIISVLQGIPSDLFILDVKSLEFSLNPMIDLKPFKISRELILSYFEEYMEAGTFYLQLSEICAYLKSNPQICGLILESFALGLSEFLVFYQYQVLNIKETVLERRIKENTMFQEPFDNLKYRHITLLELKIHLETLISQINLISFIVLKPYKQMAEHDKIELQRQEFDINGGDEISINNENAEAKEKYILSKNYWKQINEMIPLHQGNFDLYEKSINTLRKEEWLIDFPKGSNLISYLYNILISLESDLSVINLVRKLFQTTLKPYLNFVNSFIYNGDFEDPYNEFYIEKVSSVEDQLQKTPAASIKLSEIPEHQRFRIRTDGIYPIPIILSNFMTQIYKCGSTLSLLKDVEDSEYISICCSDLQKLELPSPYDMKSLNFHCSKLRDFYNVQCDNLLELENTITEEEMRQITLRK